jgi:hypothetical protein
LCCWPRCTITLLSVCEHKEPVQFQVHLHQASYWAECCMMMRLGVLHVCRTYAWSATFIQRLVSLVHLMSTAAAYKTQLSLVPCKTSSSTLAENMQRHPTPARKAAHSCKAAHARKTVPTHCNAPLMVHAEHVEHSCPDPALYVFNFTSSAKVGSASLTRRGRVSSHVFCYNAARCCLVLPQYDTAAFTGQSWQARYCCIHRAVMASTAMHCSSLPRLRCIPHAMQHVHAGHMPVELWLWHARYSARFRVATVSRICELHPMKLPSWGHHGAIMAHDEP